VPGDASWDTILFDDGGGGKTIEEVGSLVSCDWHRDCRSCHGDGEHQESIVDRVNKENGNMKGM
jgi:hypothetical protein